MLDYGKRNLLGILVDTVDYDAAVARIISEARAGHRWTVTALAVHGVMTGFLDEEHRYRLNHLDMIVPDGQPVRWGLNLLHGVGLRERVYGPTLMLRVCETASREEIPVYLYGSREAVLDRLVARLRQMFPLLAIAGAEPSRFRRLTPDEKMETVNRIREAGSGITFVGLGCPRQEVWAYEFGDQLSMPVIAVGAAFDFHAGSLPQAPRGLRRAGLEWAFRLVQEPRRLWRRYLLLNPLYLAMLALQLSGRKVFDPDTRKAPKEELLIG